MKLDLTHTPQLAALVARHEAETAALPQNPPPLLMAMHAQRQVLDVLHLAADLERQVNGLLREGL